MATTQPAQQRACSRLKHSGIRGVANAQAPGTAVRRHSAIGISSARRFQRVARRRSGPGHRAHLRLHCPGCLSTRSTGFV